MQRKTKSLLEELNALGEQKDVSYLIESKASNIITSAINLLELIEKRYNSEKAEVLERKLLNAIKTRDTGKFSKSFRKSDENN